MKRIALAATMAVALAGVAKADWVDYWGFGGGYTQSPDLQRGPGTARDMDYGYNMSLYLGWAQSEEISFAAQLSWVESEYEGSNQSLQALGVIGNVIYTCDTGDFWRPYLGGGVGGIELRRDQAGAQTGSDWAFGYQGMAGIAFNVDDTHAITVGYAYQAANDVEIKGVTPIEYASHNISIGFVFN